MSMITWIRITVDFICNEKLTKKNRGIEIVTTWLSYMSRSLFDKNLQEKNVHGKAISKASRSMDKDIGNNSFLLIIFLNFVYRYVEWSHLLGNSSFISQFVPSLFMYSLVFSLNVEVVGNKKINYRVADVLRWICCVSASFLTFYSLPLLNLYLTDAIINSKTA